jgi:hypothetical protein
MLAGSIAHATVFALVGTVVYLALRRSSPARGSIATWACLLIMAIVSVVVLGPWPRFWTFAPPHAEEAAMTAASSSGTPLDTARLPEQRPGTDGSRVATAPQARSSETAVPAGSPLSIFLRELARELNDQAGSQPPARWSWPEWLVVGFLASLCAGFVRLGLGILAVKRLRSRSLPLHDFALEEEIQLLRAELSCTRKVAVRETSELATPATLGWRRPLLLLPFDWRDWSHAELRAVLAHELAHVIRGDFLTGLIAQISVALHFYHPLAHWLAKRLRLEQELAADAWGAELSGGSPNYLLTLAQMALRNDDRGIAGPARAFLPSRGTLVTRIEMLRKTHVLRTGIPPVSARAGTIGVLALLGLAVAGLRGPTGPTRLQAQTQERNGRQALEQRIARDGALSLDLSLLPAETKMFFALQPAVLLERDEIKSLVRSMQKSALAKAPFVIPFEEIDQLVCFWEGIPEPPGQLARSPFIPPPSGIVIHSKKTQDWKTGLDQNFGSAEERRQDGQTYVRFTRPMLPGWCGFTPDDRTLVLSGEETLRDLIRDRKAPVPRRAWDSAWDKAGTAQLTIALETRWLRRRLAQAAQPGQGQPPAPFGYTLDVIAPLLEKAQAYVISLDATRGINLDVRAVAVGAENAKPVAETMQALLTLGRNTVDAMKHGSDGQPGGDAMKYSLDLAGSLLAQASVETSANLVHLQAKSPIELLDVVKSLTPAVTAARTSARRAMSMNNLKQIGLAFHNYASANGHFPSPTLLGGEQKTIPYSWRVAILPYLEQDALYRQYRFDEPWDGPNNRKLIDQMPAVYSVSGPDGTASSRSTASYYVFSGETTALGSAWSAGGRNSDASLTGILDGTSNTILAVEWQGNVPWTKPDDIPFDPNGAMPAMGGFWPDGFDVLMCDGSVRAVKKGIPPLTLKALITRAGGEVIDLDAINRGRE